MDWNDAIHKGSAALVGTIGQTNLESLAATNKLYNGEGFDTRTRLYNFRARNYSAFLGRFESLDPFAGNPNDPFTFNNYGFVHGNPVMGVDPTGLMNITSTLSSIAIREGNFAIKKPGLFGAIQGRTTGFLDSLLEDGDFDNALHAAAWGAAFGYVGGRVLGHVAAKLGPRLSKLHPRTGVRLLYGMFAANFAAIGYGVYTAKTSGQGGFRAALGLMGLVANQFAINWLSEWARNLRNVDTMVLASTSRESSSMGVSAAGRNVIRINNEADQIGDIGESIAIVRDQADLPIPENTFSTIVERNVQIEGADFSVGGVADRTFLEWFRVAKPGCSLRVSISSGGFPEIRATLARAGFTNIETGGRTFPHGYVVTAKN